MPMTLNEAEQRFRHALKTGNGRAAKRYLRRVLRICNAHVPAGRLTCAMARIQRYANRHPRNYNLF